MSNLRDIKQRINSVIKTRKITLAMKMVAAAKFKRAQVALKHAMAYDEALQGIVSDLGTRLEADELPSILQENDSKMELVIVVTGDRGLCGGFNANILKAAHQYISTLDPKQVELHLIGNQGIRFFKRRTFTIAETHGHIVDKVDEAAILKMLDPIVAQYEAGKYGRVRIFYNEFISALASRQVQKQLLPVSLEGWKADGVRSHSDFFYEPDKKTVLENFLSKALTHKIYTALMNSHAAEEGSRMAAMDSASENATEVVHDLTLLYNRNRQTAITTEISEIVAGAATL